MGEKDVTVRTVKVELQALQARAARQDSLFNTLTTELAKVCVWRGGRGQRVPSWLCFLAPVHLLHWAQAQSNKRR